MRNISSIADKTFGLLTALSKRKSKNTKNSYWVCLCECGNHTTVSRCHLVSGHTKSCGCYGKSIRRAALTTHGLSKAHPSEYQTWKSMRRRCLVKSYKNYVTYGGRGITICDRWASFKNFLDDMGKRPSNLYSIDRIDNNENYTPGNCRWATRYTQSNNRRNNIKLTLHGLTMNISQWSERLDIGDSTIRARVKVYGWSDEEALTTPVGSRRKS